MSVEDLVSADKLTRDRALEAVAIKVAENNAQEVINILQAVYLLEEDERWEVHLGKLEAASILLQANISFDRSDCEKWNSVVLRNLDNSESRVRQAASKLAGKLVRLAGPEFYNFFRDLAVDKLKLFMIRDDKEQLTETDEPKTSDVVLHDTAGWRSLESYMLLLQEIMTAFVESAESFDDEMQGEHEHDEAPGVDKELVSLVCDASEHRNRFVREMSHRVIESIVSMMDVNKYMNEKTGGDDDDVVNTLCCLIVKGLSDNWSQVRMSASVVTRTFCTSLTETNLDKFLVNLLPPMCLNRYYIAEGVRIYSQETWKRVFGDRGRRLVAQNIQHVIDFYISQSEAENHAVREAVCACITELVLKMDKDALQPHVSTLLDVLFICFDDDSWPVRDSACVATGHFVETFPAECINVSEDILQYLYINLRDNIASVREGAASSLKRFLTAYPNTAYAEQVIQDTHKGLEAVSEQKQMSTVNENMDKGPATYSVAKQLHDNDVGLHENQIMYSCGSLAPKMRKGSNSRRLNTLSHHQNGTTDVEQEPNSVQGVKKPRDTGGCSGHSFRRPGQPWEITDGFVLLLGELSSVESFRKYLNESMLLLFSNIFKYKHFTHHTKLFTTCYKVLSTMFTNVGKMATKRCLEYFLDGLLYGLSVDNKLALCAAQDCFVTISKLIGPNILRGRVENFDSRKIDLLSFML